MTILRLRTGVLLGCGLTLGAWFVVDSLSRSDRSAGTSPVPSADRLARANAVLRFGGLPVYFEANHGQTDSQVPFVARTAKYTAFVTPTELVLALPAPARGQGVQPAAFPRNSPSPAADTPATHYVRMRVLGADATAAVTGRQLLPGKVHYYKGADPRGWQSDVPTYARVEVEHVYPGINVVYYGAAGRLAFDLVLAPGADPSRIRLAFDGATRATVDARGDLVLETTAGEVRLPTPVIFQELDGGRRTVPGGFVLGQARQGGATTQRIEVGVEVAPYDDTRPLVIDPVLSYSTYLGGAGDDVGYDIAVDAAGQMYVTGPTLSLNFPTENPAQPEFGGGPGCGDAFVAKLTADGQALVYATYLGGDGQDCGQAITVDAAGHAYVTGWADEGFPLVDPIQSVCRNRLPDRRPCMDAFIAKLSADGSLQYSTYLGGSEDDGFNDIGVDSAGFMYVAGGTTSPNFPTVNPLQPKNGVPSDAVIAKLNPEGSALVYSTFLGGSDIDGVTNMAVDATGNTYLLGRTDSLDFPTVQALQPASAGGSDLFVAKLNPTGSALIYSTYLGGSDHEGSEGGIAVDVAGAVYVAASTMSHDFPLEKPLQPIHHGGGSIGVDAFITKIDPGGSSLVYSTFLGGRSDDTAHDITVDVGGFAYVTGFTQSENDFPIVNAPQPVYGGGLREVFVSKLTPSGSALVFSTFLGGQSDDIGLAIAVGLLGGIYVTGQAETPGVFPTVNPLQPTTGGHKDAFISRFTQTLAAEIQIEPAIVRFGSLAVGETRTSRFFIHNTGDDTLTISAVRVSAPTLTTLSPPLPFDVAPGQRVRVWVRWMPTEPGPVRETVLVESNDADEPGAVAVVAGSATIP